MGADAKRMIQQLEADALLAGDLGQWLATQGDARAEAKRKSRFRMTLGVVLGLAAAAGLFALTRHFELTFMTGAAIIGLAAAWSHAAKAPIMRAIKERINTRIATALDVQFSCDCAPGDEYERAKTFGLLPGFDREAFEDRWWGQIGEIPFAVYEAHLQQWQGSGKNRRLVTVFRGSIMTIGFARRFHGTTLVERAGSRITFFGLRDSISPGDVKLDRVSMVDPRFAEDFWVWSSDAVEAHYLVHPQYVERLIAVEQAFQGQKIRALFQEGELLIVLDSGNMFESGTLEAAQDRDMLATCIAQFNSLANLAIQLNERPRG
jgi:hypothetical protein